jgi:hypothetical protein
MQSADLPEYLQWKHNVTLSNNCPNYNINMTSDLLTLPLWDQLGLEECDQTARAVARRLPAEFRYLGLQSCAVGEQKHRVAFFSWQRRTFALVPGADAWLGYDRDRPFQPSAAQREAWQEARLWDENLPELDVHLDVHLTPLRNVAVEPFLMEVKAADNPRRTSHAGVTANLARDGFRLPTSDEWEYACAAGSRSLWRWGDDCPLERDPYQETAWGQHRRPNAFGLHMAEDPCNVELCADENILRGGTGQFEETETYQSIFALRAWIELASAFWWRNLHPGSIDAHIRRVFAIR